MRRQLAQMRIDQVLTRPFQRVVLRPKRKIAARLQVLVLHDDFETEHPGFVRIVDLDRSLSGVFPLDCLNSAFHNFTKRQGNDAVPGLVPFFPRAPP